MVFTGRELMEQMETFAPNQYAEEWDNVGFLIGDPDRVVQKILVALDLTPEVLEEAIANKINLIITHHPFPFKSFKSIRQDDPQGKMMMSLIKEGIALYAAHTNLDMTDGGTNDVLASILSLTPIEVLAPLPVGAQNELIGIGRIGELAAPCSLKEYAEHVRKQLGLTYVRVVGDLAQPIQKVALCTGSGMGYLKDALRQGAHVFITGDVKYHEAQEALDNGIAVIDAGHYGTEVLIVPVLARLIRGWTNNQVEVMESKVNGDPFQIA